VDIMILLDQSGSMTNEGPSSRWDPVTAAIKAFVGDPTLSDMAVGIQYFPLGATTTEDPAICLSTNYVTPDVPFGDLPGHAASIVSSIDAHYFTAAEADTAPHWGTPTRPAVEGILEYVSEWAATHPERTVLLLLATDGKPSNLCAGNTIDGIASALTAASSAVPSIQTYVIGIGEVDRLQVLAEAGATGSDAFIVDAAGGTATQDEFVAALAKIRQLSRPCDYAIPPAQAGSIDYEKVNVVYAAEDGSAPTDLAQVSGVESCSDATLDWYYDDLAAPTRVVLCPAACEEFAGRAGSIDLVFGCDTVVR
jgi:hypothetical protein